MKVTKSGITFTNEEMKNFVFPALILGWSKEMDNLYDKSTPKAVKKTLRDSLNDSLQFATELAEKTGVTTLEKNKRGIFSLTWLSDKWPKKFNQFPNGVVKTKEISTKKK